MPINNALPPELRRLDSTQIHYFTPAEVAQLFRVDPKTVTRWAKAGYIEAARTLGGHRRYAYAEVKRHYERLGGTWPLPEPNRPAA